MYACGTQAWPRQPCPVFRESRELSRQLEQQGIALQQQGATLRQSEDRLRTVVAELQHRTRNLISVVGTMAKGTLRASKTFDEFSTTFQNRLEVLGRAQGLLLRTEGGRVTFDELINTELAVTVRSRWRKTGNARGTERHSSALPHSPIPSDGPTRGDD
jgi:HWE histidine kinase